MRDRKFLFKSSKIWKVSEILLIGICDNDDQENNILEQIIKDYFEELKLTGQVYKFTNPQKLLNSKIDYDAIFLGITFNNFDGIDLGHLLRMNNYTGEIIFVSSKTNYALASYEVKAFQFIKKPIYKEKIFPVLHAIRARKRKEYKYLDTPEGERKINLEEVLYADIRKRNVCCHLRDKIYYSKTLKTSFENYIGTLAYHPSFIFIPPSLIINLDQIEVLNKDNLTFKNRETLYFPKTAYNEIQRRWKNL